MLEDTERSEVKCLVHKRPLYIKFIFCDFNNLFLPQSRQGGSRQAVKNGGWSLFAAGGVQRSTGCRAGGSETAGSHVGGLHQQSEGGAHREREETRGKYTNMTLKEQTEKRPSSEFLLNFSFTKYNLMKISTFMSRRKKVWFKTSSNFVFTVVVPLVLTNH